jgi:hypothetical protein
LAPTRSVPSWSRRAGCCWFEPPRHDRVGEDPDQGWPPPSIASADPRTMTDRGRLGSIDARASTTNTAVGLLDLRNLRRRRTRPRRCRSFELGVVAPHPTPPRGATRRRRRRAGAARDTTHRSGGSAPHPTMTPSSCLSPLIVAHAPSRGPAEPPGRPRRTPHGRARARPRPRSPPGAQPTRCRGWGP